MPRSRYLPIEIPAFGGINKLHTRQIGQSSSGKNFWTHNGVLYTREGTTLLSETPFTSAIRSIHSAGKAQISTRLLVEEGTKLWHRLAEGYSWEAIKSDVAGNKYSSTIWSTPDGTNYLLLGSGLQMLKYDIGAATLESMVNLDGVMPNLEFMVTWKGRVFGWAPNFSYGNLLRFCGYDPAKNVSIDYWPEDFAIDPSGTASEPVLNAIPAQTHLLVLTNRANYRIYGDNEDNFSNSPGSNIGVYAVRCSDFAGDYAIFLGEDKKVYAYSGTSPYSISQPVDEFLVLESYADVWARGMGNRFWLMFPDATNGITTAYVFDTIEQAWYIHVIPAVLKCRCMYGGYLETEYPYFGLNDSRVLWLNPNATTDFGNPITTEFTLGPFHIADAKFKAKSFWINAEPRNDFSLDVYSQVDDKDEQGPKTVDFTTGNEVTKKVRLIKAKGRNLSLRITTTDKINELQHASVTVKPGQVK